MCRDPFSGLTADTNDNGMPRNTDKRTHRVLAEPNNEGNGTNVRTADVSLSEHKLRLDGGRGNTPRGTGRHPATTGETEKDHIQENQG